MSNKIYVYTARFVSVRELTEEERRRIEEAAESFGTAHVGGNVELCIPSTFDVMEPEELGYEDWFETEEE